MKHQVQKGAFSLRGVKTMNNPNGIYRYVAIVCLLTWTLLYAVPIVGAMAASPQVLATPLSQQVKNSDLIFYGVVTKLENAVLGPGPGSEDGPLPHTYVTYQIEGALKGRSADGGSVTLRFLGGSMPDGRHLGTSHMPQFKVGDHDLLFVWKNTESDCPLVDCRNGRFRIVKNHVYGNNGHPVVRFQEGIFLYGKRETGSSEPFTLEEFKARIVEVVQQLYTPKILQTLEPIRSARPGSHETAPFFPEQPAPGVTPSPPPLVEPISEADRLEEEALERNLGNPVLKENPAR